MPFGCHDDAFPWIQERKQMYVVHAAVNAILNKNSLDLKDCIMYSTRFPCNECAKPIIQSGIQKVYYTSEKHNHYNDNAVTITARRMLNHKGVSYEHYFPPTKSLVINYEDGSKTLGSPHAHDSPMVSTSKPVVSTCKIKSL